MHRICFHKFKTVSLTTRKTVSLTFRTFDKRLYFGDPSKEIQTDDESHVSGTVDSIHRDKMTCVKKAPLQAIVHISKYFRVLLYAFLYVHDV